MAFTIVGLGNPGEEYENTRHNLGRMVVMHIAEKIDADEWKHDKKLNALRTKGEIDGEKVDLILPETFMNKSGGAVATLIKSEKAAEKLLIIYDEIDLPLGGMKVSFDRSSGGHRGVESMIKALKTQKFVRLRVGIAPTTPSGKIKKPSGEDAVVDFLLGKLNKKEMEAFPKIKKRAFEITSMIVTEGREKAMNFANQLR